MKFVDDLPIRLSKVQLGVTKEVSRFFRERLDKGAERFRLEECQAILDDVWRATYSEKDRRKRRSLDLASDGIKETYSKFLSR